MTDRERKVARANEIIKEKEAGLAGPKNLPKKHNVLEVPLDYYLQGKVSGGFKEKQILKKKTKEELIGEGSKQKRLEEEKSGCIRPPFCVSDKRAFTTTWEWGGTTPCCQMKPTSGTALRRCR